MTMKQSLHLKMGHQLAITPQLQQAIRLLQLSTLELQTEIQEALDSNPMLEAEDDYNTPDSAGDQLDTLDNSRINSSDKEQALDDTLANGTAEPSIDLDAKDTMPDELPIDSGWEDVYEPTYNNDTQPSSDSGRDISEIQTRIDTSLQAHLMAQMALSKLSARDLFIAEILIDSINDHGYMTEKLEDIVQSLNHQVSVDDETFELDEVKAVLHLIQQLDPQGCGARDTGECIALQLQQMPAGTEGLDDALLVTEQHLDLLAIHDYTKLRRKTGLTETALFSAIGLIRSLNPRPGSKIAASAAQYIIPDIFVRKEKGLWRVEINPDIAPKIGINKLYSNMIKRADKSSENTFMRTHLQEARWFIKSLKSRNETMLRVATAIISRQRGFLEYGEVAMKPMVLRDIAEQLDMHESTISRVTTQKYLHTPRGIFEFKYFFSSHVNTSDGGECSATAICAMIKAMIEKEDSKKPMSDNKIANILVNKGINIARRTVAKYREGMLIPPSNERKWVITH